MGELGDTSTKATAPAPAGQLWDQVWQDPHTGEPERWNYLAELVYRALADRLPAGGRLAEAGAGSGRLAAALVRGGGQAVYLDFSRASLRFLAARGDGLTVGADVRALPLRPGVLDGCFSSGVLEHFPEPEQRAILAEMARVVRPGGSVVLITPYRTQLFLLGQKLLRALNRWPFGYEEPLRTFRPLWPNHIISGAETPFGFFMLYLGLLKTLRLGFLYRPLDIVCLWLWQSPFGPSLGALDRALARLCGGYLLIGSARVR
ncbi:MAG TPA: class I SAM-dependent methyltransferase [bacterium]|nr:class I SAM-dependent methyltransferase [bacterium]